MEIAPIAGIRAVTPLGPRKTGGLLEPIFDIHALTRTEGEGMFNQRRESADRGLEEEGEDEPPESLLTGTYPTHWGSVDLVA